MNIISEILTYLKKRSKLVVNVVVVVLVVVLLITNGMSMLAHSRAEQARVAAITDVDAMQTENENLKEENKKLNVAIDGYKEELEEKDSTIVEQQTQIDELQDKVDTYQRQAANKVQHPDPEYTQATVVWNHLKGLGLNDYVCAGILGNIMAEVGGQTLDFSNWEHWSQGTHYGICQWGGSRKDRLLKDYGGDFQSQVTFLGVELFEEIPRENSFYDMQNEKEAALYFAKYYERCSSKYYNVRKSNATKALNYFT